MTYSKEKIISLMQEHEALDEYAKERFQYIVDIANDTDCALIGREFYIRGITDVNDTHIEIAYDVSYCGCHDDEREWATIPWDVWFGDDDDIYAWREEVKEMRDAKKKRDEAKRKQDALREKRAQLERLKAELGEDE